VGRDVVGALPDLVTASVSAEPTLADRTAIAIVFPMTSPHSAAFGILHSEFCIDTAL